MRVTTSKTSAVASTTKADTVHTSNEMFIFFSFQSKNENERRVHYIVRKRSPSKRRT
jgi:hypothetical protein